MTRCEGTPLLFTRNCRIVGGLMLIAAVLAGLEVGTAGVELQGVTHNI